MSECVRGGACEHLESERGRVRQCGWVGAWECVPDTMCLVSRTPGSPGLQKGLGLGCSGAGGRQVVALGLRGAQPPVAQGPAWPQPTVSTAPPRPVPLRV